MKLFKLWTKWNFDGTWFGKYGGWRKTFNSSSCRLETVCCARTSDKPSLAGDSEAPLLCVVPVNIHGNAGVIWEEVMMNYIDIRQRNSEHDKCLMRSSRWKSFNFQFVQYPLIIF